MEKYIYLPATQKHISIHEYVRCWKLVIENPNMRCSHGLNTWWEQSGKEVRTDYIKGLHDRINLRGLKVI